MKHGAVGVRFSSFAAYSLLEFATTQGKDGPVLGYKITLTPRTDPLARNPLAYAEQAERQVWRVAYFWLKAKYEAIDFGLVEGQQEFMPYMMLDVGGESKTVAQAFFESMAGRLQESSDPFRGAKVHMLPSGQP